MTSICERRTAAIVETAGTRSSDGLCSLALAGQIKDFTALSNLLNGLGPRIVLAANGFVRISFATVAKMARLRQMHQDSATERVVVRDSSF